MWIDHFELPNRPSWAISRQRGFDSLARTDARSRKLLIAVLAGFILLGTATLPMGATAQTAALPTAPGADRATQGGAAEAPASLPKVRGASPLEPYLITWLLPVSGIIIAALCLGMDRRLRAYRSR
jgi:hypothetical protein